MSYFEFVEITQHWIMVFSDGEILVLFLRFKTGALLPGDYWIIVK